MMRPIEESALLMELCFQLRQRDSWCGETHMQKAAYFLKELVRVPLSFEFIMYKHGPFSFDLRSKLTELRADGYLRLVPQPYPYGPKLEPSMSANKLRKFAAHAVDRYSSKLAVVAKELAPHGVQELERIATALYVMRNRTDAEPVDALRKLKPHVSATDARDAFARLKVIQTSVSEAQ